MAHVKNSQPGKKARGRTNIPETLNPGTGKAPKPSARWTQVEQRTQAARPVGPGNGAHRGDRRDMNKAYTGTQKHAARGNTPRVNVATRKN